MSLDVFLAYKPILFGLFNDSFCETCGAALLFLLCSAFVAFEQRKNNQISTCAFLIGFMFPNAVILILFFDALFFSKDRMVSVSLPAGMSFFAPCALSLLADKKARRDFASPPETVSTPMRTAIVRVFFSRKFRLRVPDCAIMFFRP